MSNIVSVELKLSLINDLKTNATTAEFKTKEEFQKLAEFTIKPKIMDLFVNFHGIIFTVSEYEYAMKFCNDETEAIAKAAYCGF